MIEGDDVGHGRGSGDGVGRGELGRGMDDAWLMGLSHSG